VDEKHKNLVKGPSNVRWDNRIFYGITTSRRIERIRVINNANDGDGIVLDDIQFGLVPGQQPGESAAQGIRVFSAVAKQDSKVFKSAVHKSLRMVSPQNWDPVPYHMIQPFSTTINAKPGQRFVLAGDPGQIIANSTPVPGTFHLLEVDLTAGNYDVRVEGNGSERDVVHVLGNQFRIEVASGGAVTFGIGSLGTLDVRLVTAAGQPEPAHAKLEGGQPVFSWINPVAAARILFWVSEGDYTLSSRTGTRRVAIRTGAVKALTLAPQPDK
jgi:hypothetical protein